MDGLLSVVAGTLEFGEKTTKWSLGNFFKFWRKEILRKFGMTWRSETFPFCKINVQQIITYLFIKISTIYNNQVTRRMNTVVGVTKRQAITKALSLTRNAKRDYV